MRDCLIKFAKTKSHLIDFVDNGRVYVNPTGFFQIVKMRTLGSLINLRWLAATINTRAHR